MGLVPFPQSLPALSLAVRFLPLFLPHFLRLPPIQITKEDRSLFQSVSQFPKKLRPSTRTPPSWKFPHSKEYKNHWNRFLRSGYRLLYGLLFLHLHTIHKDRLPGLFPLDCSGKTHKFYMVSPALSFPEGFSLSASFPAVQVLSPQTEKEPPKQFLSLYPLLFFPVLSDPGVNDLLHNLFLRFHVRLYPKVGHFQRIVRVGPVLSGPGLQKTFCQFLVVFLRFCLDFHKPLHQFPGQEHHFVLCLVRSLHFLCCDPAVTVQGRQYLLLAHHAL